MARVTVEDSLKRVVNRFDLAVIVSKRVKQLLRGDQPLVASKNKHVVTALREVAAGKVYFNYDKLSTHSTD